MERACSFLVLLLSTTILLPTDFYKAICSAPVSSTVPKNSSGENDTEIEAATDYVDTSSKEEASDFSQPCGLESGEENCTLVDRDNLSSNLQTLNENSVNVSTDFDAVGLQNASDFAGENGKVIVNRTNSETENFSKLKSSDIVFTKTFTTARTSTTASKATSTTSTSSAGTTTTTLSPKKVTAASSSSSKSQNTGTKGDKKKEDTGKPTSGHKSGKQSEYLAHHFTGFVQNVWLPNPTPHTPNPVEDGPFGSILWRDKKYLVSVLIPIGVGFTGAMMIIVMAYVSRAWRKRKERAHAQGTPRSFLEAATSKTEDTCPLHESSDDEF